MREATKRNTLPTDCWSRMFGVCGVWMLFGNNYVLAGFEVFNLVDQREAQYRCIETAHRRSTKWQKRVQVFVTTCRLCGNMNSVKRLRIVLDRRTTLQNTVCGRMKASKFSATHSTAHVEMDMLGHIVCYHGCCRYDCC
jgi:hypothetical protein